MLKEKMISYTKYSEAAFQESQIISFNKYDKQSNSFRVYKDGFAGIYFQFGKVDDKEGYKKAEDNLELKRPYPFDLESGKRSRDKTEVILSDQEILKTAKKVLSYLKKIEIVIIHLQVVCADVLGKIVFVYASYLFK